MLKQLQEIVNGGHIRTVTGGAWASDSWVFRGDRNPTPIPQNDEDMSVSICGLGVIFGRDGRQTSATADGTHRRRTLRPVPPDQSYRQRARPAASPPAAPARANTIVPTAFSSPVPGRPLWTSRTVSTLAVLNVV